jgi:hypothetical protein
MREYLRRRAKQYAEHDAHSDDEDASSSAGPLTRFNDDVAANGTAAVGNSEKNGQLDYSSQIRMIFVTKHPYNRCKQINSLVQTQRFCT